MRERSAGPETVSVITPARDCRHTLGRLADSLDSQGLAGDEIQWVVVDDGSVDGTADWLDQLRSSATFRLLVLRTTGVGAGAARNLGLSAVDNGWVTFADADDELEPGALAYWRAAATNLNVDVLITPPTGDIPRRMQLRLGLASRALEAHEKWRGEVLRAWSAWGKLYRREALQGIQFPATKETQDLAFYVSAVLSATRIGVAPGAPRYVYGGPSRAAADSPVPDAQEVFELYESVFVEIRRYAPDLALAIRGSSPVVGGLAFTLVRALRKDRVTEDVRALQAGARRAFGALPISVMDLARVHPRDRLICAVGLSCAAAPPPLARGIATAWGVAKKGISRKPASWSRRPASHEN